MAALRRVLIIDDDPITREILRVVGSQEEGVEIVGMAEDGTEGVRLANELKPDVVVVDHVLQAESLRPLPATPRRRPVDTTGLEIIAYLKHADPSVRVILYTARAGLTVAAQNAGADLYMEKGESPSKLFAAVRELST